MKWHLETRKISTLKDHPKNPRRLSKNDFLHLKKSIENFGLIDKPVITKDGMIIGGHQRKEILKKLSVKEIECWVPENDLSQDQIDELNIRLNRNTGEWDYDILANKWDIENLIDWGFEEEELLGSTVDEILNETEEDKTLEPKKDEDAFTKLGDLYELNNHRLVCGDSTDKKYVDLCLNENIPILMVTDAPYGVNYDPVWRVKRNSKNSKASCGIVKNDDIFDWSLSFALFPGSVAYVWHPSLFSSEIKLTIENIGFVVINQIIWVKQHFPISRGDYHWQHESCWYAVKKGCKHNWQGSRKETTVWEIKSVNGFSKGNKEEDKKTCHSTQKPIECMERPIRNNTAEGESVYDPFLGSGTTLLAAEQLNRTCYGLEISPAYCDIIVERWVNHMNRHNKTYQIKKNGELWQIPQNLSNQ